ncbi:MAG: anthranilate synthase component I, partial [Gammaproteobacteria bacterium]|nr:anthranilate synthase component I [Gammaproteobacteria bacterium]
MDEKSFNSLVKKGYNRIPLMREVLADLDTPLSTYLKLANGPYSYLFESVQGGEKWGRYSIIGLPCQKVIKIFAYEIQTWLENQQTESITVDDPLEWVQNYYDSFKIAEVDGLPRFNGGLVGYFGYDTIRYIEPRLAKTSKPDEL